MFELSRTEQVWMARLKKGRRRQQFKDLAVDRLIGRGLVVFELRGSAKQRHRVLTLAVPS